MITMVDVDYPKISVQMDYRCDSYKYEMHVIVINACNVLRHGETSWHTLTDKTEYPMSSVQTRCASEIVLQ